MVCVVGGGDEECDEDDACDGAGDDEADGEEAGGADAAGLWAVVGAACGAGDR